MLKELYFVPDIMERYRCKTPETARRYMREMGAKGCPLFVTEDMIRDWELTKRIPIPPRGPVVVSAGMKIPRRK